jgi:PadR family transcriptional regulator PadR
MSADYSLGAFEEQVMLAVLHARDAASGMTGRRALETRPDRDGASGAVYATLDRLEQKGLITSTRVAGEGGSRRVFSVTAAGTRALFETRAMRDRLWQGLDPRLLGAKGRA